MRVLLVRHGGPRYLLLCHLQGYDMLDSYMRLALENCAISEVVVD